MNKTKVLCVLLIGMLSCGFSQETQDSLKVEQLEEVVLSDSRFKLKRENSGKVITRITSNDLDKLQGKSIAEIISRTAGIEVNGVRSNAGQNLSYFVRGGRNRQVLVLIDGIQVTDASQIANDYDLRLLNADQVDSIEILKGASSTLYGSNAATAVINIKLKEAKKDDFKINLRSTLGTNQSQDDDNFALEDFRNSITLNGKVGDLTYLANFGHQFTDGLSAIANGTESDTFNSYNGSLKLGYTFSNALKIKAYASFDNFKADFDDSFGLSDANNLSTTKQHRIGISPEFNYTNGTLTINAALNSVERNIDSSFPTAFNAESIVIDAFNRYNFNDQFYTVLGLNYQQSNMESFAIPFGSSNLEQTIDPDIAEFTLTDPYANMVFISDFGLNVNAGLRLNNHSEYGSQLVYSINPSYRLATNFGYVKGIASYSTAYIVPSLFQLFDATFGNLELEPEENQTFEFGAEVGFKNNGSLSLVYFNRNEENFVDFVDTGGFVFQYRNTGDAFTASGLEFTANYKFLEKITLNTNLTYTRVEDDLNLRIPEFVANARLDYQVSDNTLLSLAYKYTDARNDRFTDPITFAGQNVTLDAFNILDAYVSHKILKGKMTVFANVTNVFNEEYQELFGFSTLGRNVNMGFNLEL